MPWDTGLEGPARTFAQATERRVRCLAGPGTGKTFALLRRVQRLLEAGVPPERVLVVTLTRTAADDLKTSLARLGVPGADRVVASTLHALCFSVLRRDAVLQMTGRIPRILAQFEADFILRDLRDEFGGIRDKRALLTRYEAAWAALVGDPLGTPTPGLEQAFYTDLMESLAWHQGMFVGELVPLARAYLAQNPHAADLARFDHVLVDEYQDLNRADHAVVELLAARGIEQGGGLAVIGDDDQSIYVMLRHAFPEGIVQFPHDQDVPLVECRRCPKRVVAMAQRLIEFNPDRARPALEARAGNPDGVIHNVAFATMEDEANGLARFIVERLRSEEVAPGDVLLLTNWRDIAYGIRDRIVGAGFDAHSYFSEEALDTSESKEAITLLQLLAYPDDRVALRTWLGLQQTNGAVASYRRLRTRARDNGHSVSDVLRALAAGDLQLAHVGRCRTSWTALQQRLDALQALVDAPRELIDALLPEGVPEVASLRRCAVRLIDRLGDEPTVQDLADGLRREVTVPEVPLDAPFVRLMSLHRSKGLTAKLVVIAGMVEGLIPRLARPNYDADQAERHMHEQRRVLFVGLTRTTNELTLSRFARVAVEAGFRSGMRLGPAIGGGYRRTIASGYLAELGEELPDAVRGEEWAY